MMARRLSAAAKYMLLSLLTAAAIAPFWWLAVTSLRADGVYAAAGWEMFVPAHLTLEYYAKLFQVQEQLPLARLFLNTLFLCGVGVVLEVSLAALAA